MELWHEAWHMLKAPHLFEGDGADEPPDAGDVGVVETQQGEDGVSLEKNNGVRRRRKVSD